MRQPIRPWRQWTLRTRLVVAMATLTLVALLVANVSAVLVLRSYLVGRLDQQLIGQSQMLSQPDGLNAARTPPRPGIGPAFLEYLYSADGTKQLLTPVTGGAAAPELGSWSALSAHAPEHPFTVNGSDGTTWRIDLTPVGATGQTAVTALSMQDVTETSDNLLAIDAAVTAAVLLLVSIAAASVVRIGLRPLTRMEGTATDIAAATDLSRRVADVDPHTETGRLGTAVNAMLARVEAALAARTASEQRLRQFLADASHELRTPLTSIQGFAELYRRGGTPPGPVLDEAMGRIESEVIRMRGLVNDLLQLARLDEERPTRRTPVDLLGLAAETVRDAHVRVPARSMHLAALDDAFDTFEPVTVLGDDDRLRQVATNLVSNAIQHTPDDARIVVRVGFATVRAADLHTAGVPDAATGRELARGAPVAVLEVADTGPGMPAGDAAHVFERLFRVERSRDRRHGGAGLGLAIVAAIVQAHDGRVELRTAPGAGTSFRVLLPVLPDLDVYEGGVESTPGERTPGVESRW
jgi:two-component system, OmpR family, sensor kinase